LALWYEKTGDKSAKDRAFRSFNWATYSSQESGLVKTSIDEGTGYWFSDGYGDYMRHFQRGMASAPEWAPSRSNHLLGSTSLVRKVSYTLKRIAYETFDKAGDEILRVIKRPRAVSLNGRMLVIGKRSSSNCQQAVLERLGNGFVLKIRRLHAKRVAVDF
jgi:hypothetical protein